MLSYRHAYHAGNFADVLKHIVLNRTLSYLVQKDKPLLYLDTHAGAGGYRLDSEIANKTAEYLDGIAKLWGRTDLPEPVAAYVVQIKQFNFASSGKKLTHYPGSPWLAQQLLRPYDRISLSELHSSEFPLLNKHFRQDERIQLQEQDGYITLNALMPPIQKRSLVLIDPSYEQKQEYYHVAENIIKAYKKFPTGVYALWYPVVDRALIDRLEKTFKRSGVAKIQLFELSMTPDTAEYGMTGSGMIVINPPYNLMDEMRVALPYLVKVLSPDTGSYRAEVLVGDKATESLLETTKAKRKDKNS